MLPRVSAVGEVVGRSRTGYEGPHGALPAPDWPAPNHGAGCLADPRAARYEPTRAEVLPGLWFNLFVRR